MSLLSFCEWLAATPGSIALHESHYLYLIVLTVHVMTLCVFGGTAVLLNLRLVGVTMLRVPVSELMARLLPWTVAALAVEADFMSEAVKAKAIRVGNDMAGSFEKAHKAGVNIAYGTDSGISKHGSNAEEAVLMVEAGMSEMDVIVAATINAADLIDMSDSIGTIEAGKFADIIAVDASPLENIDALLDVSFVMKNGKIYKD